MRVRDEKEDWGIQGSEAATKNKVKGGVISRSVTCPDPTEFAGHSPALHNEATAQGGTGGGGRH